MAVQVIIGATGIVIKVLTKNFEATPGKHSLDSLSKTVVFGTSYIMRKVLQSRTSSLRAGDHSCFGRSIREKSRKEIIIIIIILQSVKIFPKFLMQSTKHVSLEMALPRPVMGKLFWEGAKEKRKKL
jgi:hypothetical protein